MLLHVMIYCSFSYIHTHVLITHHLERLSLLKNGFSQCLTIVFDAFCQYTRAKWLFVYQSKALIKIDRR